MNCHKREAPSRMPLGAAELSPQNLGLPHCAAGTPTYPRLLSELPTHLSTELFACAELVRLSAGRVLFRAGDSGDGCYRIENGLLKVTWFRAPAPSVFLPSSAG